MTDHEHDWKPHSTVNARYRCSICKAIGYKPKARGDEHSRTVDKFGVRPYACASCGGPAVALEYNSQGTSLVWRCANHRTAR